jgi:hypothetical protein
MAFGLGHDDYEVRQSTDDLIRAVIAARDISPLVCELTQSRDAEIAHRARNILTEYEGLTIPYYPKLSSLEVDKEDSFYRAALEVMDFSETEDEGSDYIYVEDREERIATAHYANMLLRAGRPYGYVRRLLISGLYYERSVGIRKVYPDRSCSGGPCPESQR